MITKILRNAFTTVALFSLAAVAAHAQTENKEVKKAPIKMISAASGVDMFNSYCAPCHGKDGKGTGPAASALKIPPVDLTQLAKKNGGKFPSDHVGKVLRSGVAGAHGSADMPVWGPLFSQIGGGDDAMVQLRISNLIHYLETLQAK